MSKEIVKCRYCKQLEEKNPDVIVTDCTEDNKLMKQYIHIDCKIKQLKEQDALDKLISTILNIYHFQTPTDIPSLIYTKINQIRNGTYKTSIRYKQGYSYTVIDKAFQMAKKNIQWALENKHFVVNTKNPNNYMTLKRQKQLLYGLAIVYKSLPQAYKELKREVEYKRKLKQEVTSIKENNTTEFNNVSFAPKQDNKKYDWLEDDNE